MAISPWFDTAIVGETYAFPRSGVALVAIPKNGCTALKASFLASEGVSVEGFDSAGIHSKANDFRLFSTSALSNLKCVIALRSPFKRLRSAYFDKFVLNLSEDAEQVIRQVWRLQRGKARVPKDASISFEEFIGYLRYSPNHNLDLHYRPQADFFWLSFSHIIDLDVPGNLESSLESLGILPIPAPPGNATSSAIVACPPSLGARTDGVTWRSFFRSEGGLPPVEQLLDPWLHYRIRERFADDFDLRAEVC